MAIDARANLEDENAKRFDELQEFLKERSNHQKYGNANTLRLAVKLGHERMQELKEERKETVEEFKKYEKKIENAVNEI
jgi:dTDP-D-glucose 4,6-dehydratase